MGPCLLVTKSSTPSGGGSEKSMFVTPLFLSPPRGGTGFSYQQTGYHLFFLSLVLKDAGPTSTPQLRARSPLLKRVTREAWPHLYLNVAEVFKAPKFPSPAPGGLGLVTYRKGSI